jgi:hypothetical protein
VAVFPTSAASIDAAVVGTADGAGLPVTGAEARALSGDDPMSELPKTSPPAVRAANGTR